MTTVIDGRPKPELAMKAKPNPGGVILCPHCQQPRGPGHVCGQKPADAARAQQTKQFFEWLQKVLNDIDGRLKRLEAERDYNDKRVSQLEKRFNKVKAIVKAVAKQIGFEYGD